MALGLKLGQDNQTLDDTATGSGYLRFDQTHCKKDIGFRDLEQFMYDKCIFSEITINFRKSCKLSIKILSIN